MKKDKRYKILFDEDLCVYEVILTDGIKSFEVATFTNKTDAEKYIKYMANPSKNISVYLPTYLIECMDKEKEHGLSRSDVVRKLLEEKYGLMDIR